jgi:hypothetical protein
MRCHWPHGWDIAGERARPGGRFRRRAMVGMARCAVRLPALSCPRRAGRNSAGQQRESASGDIAAQCPYQSARGLAHSKTLRAVRRSSVNAPASWSAVALHRFFIAHQTRPQFQTPFTRVRPPQTAIGRCLRTATNWDSAGERARPGCRFRRRARCP